MFFFLKGDQVYKSVFIIFFQGDQLKTRVKKICEGFRATLYPCPETPAERREMAIGVMTRIEDLNTVLGQTQDHRHRVLVAAAKNIKNWFVKVRKIKVMILLIGWVKTGSYKSIFMFFFSPSIILWICSIWM